MADDNPVTAPAEAEKPEPTLADKQEMSETVAASDEITTGKEYPICILQPPMELPLEILPHSGPWYLCATNVR